MSRTDKGCPVGDQEYVFVWSNTPEREKLKGRRCRIVAVEDKDGTVTAEFLDNKERVSVDRRALRNEA